MSAESAERPQVIGTFQRSQIKAEGAAEKKGEILQKLDDLIWRRKIQEKPFDQLEEIRQEVEDL